MKKDKNFINAVQTAFFIAFLMAFLFINFSIKPTEAISNDGLLPDPGEDAKLAYEELFNVSTGNNVICTEVDTLECESGVCYEQTFHVAYDTLQAESVILKDKAKFEDELQSIKDDALAYLKCCICDTYPEKDIFEVSVGESIHASIIFRKVY